MAKDIDNDNNNLFYGKYTSSVLKHYPHGNESIPYEVIKALVLIKRVAAKANYLTHNLEENLSNSIISACDLIINGNYKGCFPLKIWQSGSGTHTNMNVNEVIANLANDALKKSGYNYAAIHPNDHVNMSQSSNDTFPSAIQIAALEELNNILIPSINNMKHHITSFINKYGHISKVARTHMQDAVPITYSQEFSAYIAQLENAKEDISNRFNELYKLPLGGTAIGTGILAPSNFGKLSIEFLNELTKNKYELSSNLFESIANGDNLIRAHSALKSLAVSLIKIASDIRFLASGPRCGIGELIIPPLEAGSSIMAGKFNPFAIEALIMVAIDVIGKDTSISFAGTCGNLELNTARPLMAYILINSIKNLSEAMNTFSNICLEKLSVNELKSKNNLENNLMLAVALNKIFGYGKVADIVKKAQENNISLKEATISMSLLTQKEYDSIVNPYKMT